MKSNSSSSDPSAKDGATAAGAGAAVPYGTRSRNRTGNPRPNYAEDKEIDLELEVAQPATQSTARKIKGAEAVAVIDSGRPISTSRKGQGAEAEQNGLVLNHNKDPIPGTSTFSANPATTPNPHHGPKKRRNANQPPVSQHQIPISNQGAHNITRGAGIATQVNGGVQDSNMLTFDACRGRLMGRTLIGDDGTVLEVNGRARFLLMRFVA